MIAATVAMTIGTASAYDVPGLNSAVFQTNIDVETPAAGSAAITNINAILDAVGQTDGSTIDKDAFWQSFIQSEAVKYFNFSNAKPLIAKLVFNVLGETQNGAGVWNYSSTKTAADFKSDNSLDASEVVYRGDLKVKGQAAIDLLVAIGYNKIDTTALGHYDTSASTVETTFDPTQVTDFAAPTGAVAQAKLLDTTNPFDVAAMVSAAKINADAFNQANSLIALIALEVSDAITLDVVTAAKAVDAVIAKHNSFLGASVVAEAQKLKSVIKTIGYQIAAATLGKTAGDVGVCKNTDSNSQHTDISCVKVGEKFQDISTKIIAIDANVTNYTTALNALEGFANNLIAFNLGGDVTVQVETVDSTGAGTGVFVDATVTVPGAVDYVSGDASAAITAEFDKIVVVGGVTRGLTTAWASDLDTFDDVLDGFEGELLFDMNTVDSAGDPIGEIVIGNLH